MSCAPSPTSPTTSVSAMFPILCAVFIVPRASRRGAFARRPRATARFSKIGSDTSPDNRLSFKEAFMFDHIGLTVANLEASRRFYQKSLIGLGFELGSHDAT